MTSIQPEEKTVKAQTINWVDSPSTQRAGQRQKARGTAVAALEGGGQWESPGNGGSHHRTWAGGPARDWDGAGLAGARSHGLQSSDPCAAVYPQVKAHSWPFRNLRNVCKQEVVHQIHMNHRARNVAEVKPLH